MFFVLFNYPCLWEKLREHVVRPALVAVHACWVIRRADEVRPDAARAALEFAVRADDAPGLRELCVRADAASLYSHALGHFLSVDLGDTL